MDIKRIVAVVDTHTCGAPTRIVIGGGPLLKGETFIDRWLDFRENHDDFRKFVMWEPHGHDNMFGCLLTPPVSNEAQYGVVFMDSEGGVSMCGHGSIGIARTLVDLGMVQKAEPVTDITLETPAGVVILKVEIKDGIAGDVILQNVPGFVYAENLRATLPSTGQSFKFDIAFGGNFLAMVPAEQFGLQITPEEVGQMISLGNEIRNVINDHVEIRHPTNPALNKIQLTEFMLDGNPRRNCVTWAAGQLARSACGTGTSARTALLAARGELKPGEWYDHASVIGSIFRGSYLPGPQVGNFDTIIPFVSGRSHVTGFNWLVQQSGDDLTGGFLLKR